MKKGEYETRANSMQNGQRKATYKSDNVPIILDKDDEKDDGSCYEWGNKKDNGIDKGKKRVKEPSNVEILRIALKYGENFKQEMCKEINHLECECNEALEKFSKHNDEVIL